MQLQWTIFASKNGFFNSSLTVFRVYHILCWRLCTQIALGNFFQFVQLHAMIFTRSLTLHYSTTLIGVFISKAPELYLIIVFVESGGEIKYLITHWCVLIFIRLFRCRTVVKHLYLKSTITKTKAFKVFCYVCEGISVSISKLDSYEIWLFSKWSVLPVVYTRSTTDQTLIGTV